MKATDLTPIGVRIIQMRKEKNLSQETLAEKAGLSRNSVNSIEARNANFSVTALICICRALNVTPDDLLRDCFPAVESPSGNPNADFRRPYVKYLALPESAQKNCRQLFEVAVAQYSGDNVAIDVTKKDAFHCC